MTAKELYDRAVLSLLDLTKWPCVYVLLEPSGWSMDGHHVETHMAELLFQAVWRNEIEDAGGWVQCGADGRWRVMNADDDCIGVGDSDRTTAIAHAHRTVVEHRSKST